MPDQLHSDLEIKRMKVLSDYGMTEIVVILLVVGCVTVSAVVYLFR